MYVNIGIDPHQYCRKLLSTQWYTLKIHTEIGGGMPSDLMHLTVIDSEQNHNRDAVAMELQQICTCNPFGVVPNSLV